MIKATVIWCIIKPAKLTLGLAHLFKSCRIGVRLRVLLLLLAALGASAATPKRVLILDSFGRDVAPFNMGMLAFRRALAREFSQPVDIYEVQLDMAQFGDPKFEKPMVDFLKQRFASSPIDLVVPVGGPAVGFAAQYRQRLFADAPMLFIGADPAMVAPNAVKTNATFVREKADLPAGSVIELREPTFWEQHRYCILGVVVFCCLQTALIVGLLVNRGKLREAKVAATLIADLSAKFINVPAADVEREIEDTLRRVCECVGLDAGMLWEAETESLEVLVLTHRFQRTKEPLVAKRMKVAETFPWRLKQIHRGLVFPLASLSEVPPEAAIDLANWRRLGVKSSLDFPLAAGGKAPFGMMSYVMLMKEREWPPEVVRQLGLVTEVLANALIRKRTEDVLRENEARLNLAADSAGVGLWSLNLDTQQFWLTPKTRELFPFGEGEVVNFDRFLELIHPEDREIVDRGLRKVVRNSKEERIEFRALQPDGSVRWMLTCGRLQHRGLTTADCVMGVTMDITNRKMAEEKLRQSSEVLEKSPALVLITDAQGRINYVNRKFSEVTGYSKAEIIGKNPRLLKSGECPPIFYKELWSTITQGKIWRGEFHNRKKNGDLYWEWAVISPLIDGTGKVTHFVAIKEDITERKRAEQEIAQQRNQLTHLSRVNMLGELAGSLAHELNQPLTAVLSNAQAAQRFLAHCPPNLSEVRDILADIVAEDKRAGEVIHRLRLLLKKGEVQRQPLPVNDVVQEVLKLVRSDLVNHDFTALTELAPHLPLIHGDRVQLQQVVLNLVMNACDAMVGGTRDEHQLTIRTCPGADGYVQISVTDCGAGLAPDKLEQVFEPFYTTKPHGMGLGLAVCRTIVAAHGGKLWATNNPGRGATFHVSLPTTNAKEA